MYHSLWRINPSLTRAGGGKHMFSGGLPAGRAGNSCEEGRGAPGTHPVAITEGGLCGLAVNFTIGSSASAGV